MSLLVRPFIGCVVKCVCGQRVISGIHDETIRCVCGREDYIKHGKVVQKLDGHLNPSKEPNVDEYFVSSMVVCPIHRTKTVVLVLNELHQVVMVCGCSVFVDDLDIKNEDYELIQKVKKVVEYKGGIITPEEKKIKYQIGR